MKVADVMASNVISVTPETPVSEIAGILLQKRISAVPVVDARGRLAGIVSEGDLLRRAELHTERRRSWWAGLLGRVDSLAAEYVKTHGRRAEDVMTRDVVTASEDMSLDEVVGLLEQRHVKRLPVLSNGKLVGVVSRADLLRALACLEAAPAEAVSDETIHDGIMDRIRSEPWGMPWRVTVTVQDGIVKLTGAVSSEEERKALRVAAETVPGVREVHDELALEPMPVN